MSIEAHTSRSSGTLPASGDEGASSVELPRGAPVGRYLILEKIGAGGMGVVYSAYDPKLDRRIALKALHTATDPERDTAGRSRLIREAKAMARLSHPNVVTVYDVLAEGEQIFVAMELVEGESLRAWLEEEKEPRPWRQVVGAFVQAGRGLAAAHDAGMVHRDFKLDNVFVGNDGRVRVGDFGLARSNSTSRATRRAKKDDLGPLVSREGMLAGTPAYMAPDQLRGDPADARSDQFSFCAALYEGLYGAAPFEAKTLESLVESMEGERLAPPPASSAVPGWLRAIAARGLRSHPEDRFGSMHELLAALETDPRRTGARWVTLAVAAAAGVAVAGGIVQHRRAEVLECKATQHRVDAVWGDDPRRAVHDAFMATGRPYAEDTFGRTSRILDSYASAWGQRSVATCQEGDVRGARRGLQAERVACLDERLDELRAFVGVLARSEGETVDRAVQGARALPSLDPCGGADPLRGRALPSDPAARDDAAALEEQMRVEKALCAGGRYAEALALATKNVADAERLAFKPLTADALLALAGAQEDGGEQKESTQTYHRATLAAEAAGAPRVAALAWIGAGRRATAEGDFPRADERFDHAEAWVGRADDEALGATLMIVRGRRLSDEGKYDAAREIELKALPIFERHGSEEIPEALNDLGIDADMQGRYEEAKSYYRRAMEHYEHVLGPDHPKVAKELNNLGLMAADQGKLEEAVESLTRALHILEHAFGPDRPMVGSALYNLAIVLNGMDRSEQALPLAQRGVAIIEKTLGGDSPDMAYGLMSVVSALLSLGRAEEAIAPAERELAIRKDKGASQVNLADAECDLGMALVKSGRDVARGRALLHQSRDRFVAVDRTSRVKDIDATLAKAEARAP